MFGVIELLLFFIDLVLLWLGVCDVLCIGLLFDCGWVVVLVVVGVVM